MNAAEKWFTAAREVYAGADEARMYDRAMRAKSDVDSVVLEFLLLEELRAIRHYLQKQATQEPTKGWRGR